MDGNTTRPRLKRKLNENDSLSPNNGAKRPHINPIEKTKIPRRSVENPDDERNAPVLPIRHQSCSKRPLQFQLRRKALCVEGEVSSDDRQTYSSPQPKRYSAQNRLNLLRNKLSSTLTNKSSNILSNSIGNSNNVAKEIKPRPNQTKAAAQKTSTVFEDIFSDYDSEVEKAFAVNVLNKKNGSANGSASTYESSSSLNSQKSSLKEFTNSVADNTVNRIPFLLDNSVQDQLRRYEKHKNPNSVTATQSRNLQNIRKTSKPYSANDRLKNIRAAAKTVTNNVQERFIKKPVPLVPQSNNNSKQNNVVISSIHSSWDTIKDNGEAKRPKTANLQLQNTKSSMITNMGCSADTLPKKSLQIDNVLSPAASRCLFQMDTDMLNDESLDYEPETNAKFRSIESLECKSPSFSSLSKISCDEPMQWDPTNETESTSKLQRLQKIIPRTEFQEVVAKASSEMPLNNTILKEIYVVVDTNIFIADLYLIKRILELKINGVETPIIMIPWIVIQELDYMKDGRSGNKLKVKAQEAIRFINRKLMKKNPYVKGQSVADAAQQDFISSNLDDGILHCCLQIVKKSNNAVLLSNDINLRNKALLHNIPAYADDEILDSLNPYGARKRDNNAVKEDDRISEIKMHLSVNCSKILSEILKQDYGPIWENIKPETPVPWNFQTCMELFHRYWIPVFSLRLNKHCGKLIEDFRTYLKTKQDGIIPIKEGEKLIEFSLALCVYLKADLPQFKKFVKSCINGIQNISLK